MEGASSPTAAEGVELRWPTQGARRPTAAREVVGQPTAVIPRELGRHNGRRRGVARPAVGTPAVVQAGGVRKYGSISYWRWCGVRRWPASVMHWEGGDGAAHGKGGGDDGTQEEGESSMS